ncbi:MAG: KpsF/GutQ family sugar-phosphate isomerase [Candidatus Kapaibacterium sp.]
MKNRSLPADIVEALRLQHTAIDMLESELDEQFDAVVQALQNSSAIVCSGVGKSGFVARKFAASLTSLGLTATYMHSTDALHGDLGLVRSGTVLVLFSKSGETKELVQLLDVVKGQNIVIASITSRRTSTLSLRSHYSLCTPIEREYDRTNILPTASTTSALIMADLLVMSLAHRMPDSIETLSRTHPMGTIGSLLGQRVGEHMHSGVSLPLVESKSTLEHAIHVLDHHALGIVCVVATDRSLCGILTDGDVRRLVERTVELSRSSVNDVMTTSPTVITPDSTLHQALLVMESRERSISVLPVVEGETLVGVIRLHDVVRAQMTT